jgi:hypothetical protein
MQIKETAREVKIHHTVVVDKIQYYRNEFLTYDTNGILAKQRTVWSVGDKEGKGPFVEPGGSLDTIKKYTSKELEKMLKEQAIEK